LGRIVKGEGRVVPAPIPPAREQAARLVAEAEARAARLLAEAEARAARLLAEAEAEATRRREALSTLEAEARERGSAGGYAEGLARAAAVLAEAEAHAERARKAAAGTALALARAMAEKILSRALALDDAALADVVGQALEASRARAERVVLRVHPTDAAALQTRREELLARLPPGAALAFALDDEIPRYGCVVETAAGRVDGRIGAQLDALTAALAPRGPVTK
jgi:flagellar biosynthesis/type III secretory pathway protein FliH